ncbi:ribosomal protein s17 [Colletotrichum chrysophilum]|uniref:Ribosomal protein s17 n=1 Tax=Colletotrichum chrysophilum TaxID=1836956 RepID=A0AAD9AA75_9PEZI|nr:ribosomal protein s17 [Colletotrichum chrysophilum]
MSKSAISTAGQVLRELHGVVVTAGRMSKTVKVRVGGQQWNQKVQKMFTKPKKYLVHDPNNSLRQGDIVSIVPGWRRSPQKRHVVKSIIAPHGTPIEDRPSIPTIEELLAARTQMKETKDARRAERRQDITERPTVAPQPEVD